MILGGRIRNLSAEPFWDNTRERGIVWSAVSPHHSRLLLVPTIHLLTRPNAKLPTLVDDAIGNAGLVMIEADPGNVDDMSSALALARYGDGDGLFNHIDSATQTALKKRLEEYELPVENVEKLKPWAISFFLQDIEKKRVGFGTAPSVELLILARARELNVKIGKFESIRSQMEIYDAFPDVIQSTALRAYLEQNHTALQTRSALKKITDAWYSGNFELTTDRIERLNINLPAGVRKLMDDKLLVKRNENFVQRIETILSIDPVAPLVVAVGIKHFMENTGLLHLLKQQGYKIFQQ